MSAAESTLDRIAQKDAPPIRAECLSRIVGAPAEIRSAAGVFPRSQNQKTDWLICDVAAGTGAAESQLSSNGASADATAISADAAMMATTTKHSAMAATDVRIASYRTPSACT
jgi:hypothetical protein